MSEDGRTIYQICRKQAGYTQENAAELLGCSVRMLARYESGEVPVPDEIVCRMDQLYSNHFLTYVHFRESSRLAAGLLPEVSGYGIQTAAMQFYNQLEGLENDVGRMLLRIAEDGVIDPEERLIMEEKILPRLERLLQAIMEILITGKVQSPKGNQTEGGIHIGRD